MENEIIKEPRPKRASCDEKTISRMMELFAQVPHLSDNKVHEALRNEGIDISSATIGNYRRNGLAYRHETKSKIDEKLLESMDRIIAEFEELYNTAKRKLDEWVDDPERTEETIKTMKILVDMFTVALKKFGFLRDTIIGQVNVTQNFNEFNMFLKDIGAVVEDGKVVIKKPKPELIELLTK